LCGTLEHYIRWSNAKLTTTATHTLNDCGLVSVTTPGGNFIQNSSIQHSVDAGFDNHLLWQLEPE
jgi:hypothetical protein